MMINIVKFRVNINFITSFCVNNVNHRDLLVQVGRVLQTPSAKQVTVAIVTPVDTSCPLMQV